jgi:hypothetical protein
MAAPYLEEIRQALLDDAKDFHEVAEMVGIPFESVCLSFNNGLLKGYWHIVVNEPEQV